jgi:hypothetical protein
MNNLKGSFRSPEVVWNVEDLPRRMPWLPLYRVWGQGMYKEEGSLDQRGMSLREGPS